jgi:hypothetical protein
MLLLEGYDLHPTDLKEILGDEMAIEDVADRQTSVYLLVNRELDGYLTDALLAFFEDCAQKKKDGLKMDELVIQCGFNLCLVSLLYAVISMDVFKNLQWIDHQVFDEDLDRHEENPSLPALQLLGHILSHSERLKSLRHNSISFTAAKIRVWTELSVAASNLECLGIVNCDGISEQELEGIFASNHKLKRIEVDCLWQDAMLSHFVQRVVEHNPCLKVLDIRRSYCGNLSIGVIASCLPQHKNLENLFISDPSIYTFDGGIDTARDFSIIADAVKSGTTGLRELIICCDALCGNRDELENTLFALLQANKLLYNLNLDFGGGKLQHQARYEHCQDINWTGRILMGSAEKCPRSLWGTVLERVNNNRWWGRDRKANAIYNLLRESDMVI